MKISIVLYINILLLNEGQNGSSNNKRINPCPKLAVQQDLINYHLYNTNTRYAPTKITGNSSSIPNNTLQQNQPTKIYIHNVFTWGDTPLVKQLKEAYFSKGVKNFIAVDWGAYSGVLAEREYPEAEVNALGVGKCVGEMLLEISETFDIGLEKMHCIGHGLGGHICGYVGRFMGNNMSRISALDPPLLLYESGDGLRPDDAKFVDVIYTSEAISGENDTYGHVAFYPNGGQYQPGCSILNDAGCKLKRALDLFVDSILYDNFIAWKCEDADDLLYESCSGNIDTNVTNKMGEHAEESPEGMFYLITQNSAPFGCGNSTC